jgi:hypothetical protein
LVGREGFEPTMSRGRLIYSQVHYRSAICPRHRFTRDEPYGRWVFRASHRKEKNTALRPPTEQSAVSSPQRCEAFSWHSSCQRTRSRETLELWVYRLDSHQSFQGHNLASCSWTTTNTGRTWVRQTRIFYLGNEKEPQTDWRGSQRE